MFYEDRRGWKTRLMFILGLDKTIEKQISSSSDSENSVKSNDDKNIKKIF